MSVLYICSCRKPPWKAGWVCEVTEDREGSASAGEEGPHHREASWSQQSSGRNPHLPRCSLYVCPHQGWICTLGKGRRLPWAPKSQGPSKMLFIYEMPIKWGRLWFMVFITTTTVCMSELNVLLVYPACSKWKYCATEADCRVRSLFHSVHTCVCVCVWVSRSRSSFISMTV